jgi:sugar diacid utilization regulator
VVGRHAEVVCIDRVRRSGAELVAALEHAGGSLARSHGVGLRAGVSTICDGMAAVARGYEEARQALAMTRPSGGVVFLGDVSLADFLVSRSEGTVRRIMPAWARSLLVEDERQQGVLVATVTAYLDADLNLSRAAERLCVHHNTVQYRLKKVAALTGKNVRRFHDLVEILTAIRLARSSPDP